MGSLDPRGGTPGQVEVAGTRGTALDATDTSTLDTADTTVGPDPCDKDRDGAKAKGAAPAKQRLYAQPTRPEAFKAGAYDTRFAEVLAKRP